MTIEQIKEEIELHKSKAIQAIQEGYFAIAIKYIEFTQHLLYLEIQERNKEKGIDEVAKYMSRLSTEGKYIEIREECANMNPFEVFSKAMGELKVGDVLEAIDVCGMDDESECVDALTIGKRYTINSIKDGWFSVRSDIFDVHEFEVSDYSKYFKRV